METLQQSKDALLRLLSAVRRDVLRFEARSRSILASQPSQTREPAQPGVLALPSKKTKGQRGPLHLLKQCMRMPRILTLFSLTNWQQWRAVAGVSPALVMVTPHPPRAPPWEAPVQGLVEAAAAALVAQRDAAAPAQSRVQY